MMGWTRIRSSPSPTSSLTSRDVTLPHPPSPKCRPSSIADSLTSFDFRRKTYSEGEAETIDLVSLEPISPLRVSRSHSPSDLPQSEEVVLDYITPPSSPTISIHQVPPLPSKTKNAIGSFEQRASGWPDIQLPTAASASAKSDTPIHPSPTFVNAARAERQLRKSTSMARPSSVTGDSEDSMASLVSMLDDHNAPACAASVVQQCSTPIHHETNSLPNVRMLSPAWLHSRGSIRSLKRSLRSSEHKSDSDGSLRALSPNVHKQEEPSAVQPIEKAVLRSRLGRPDHSRSRTVSDTNHSELRPDSRNSLFHRHFSLSRRSQNRKSTDVDNDSAARLPCFMTSNDDFMNTPAVQGLRMASPGSGMGAFNDGSYSVHQSFSVPDEPQDSASTAPPLEVKDDSRNKSSQPTGIKSLRAVSASSGLPLSRRSMSFSKVARATSAVSFFTRPPQVHKRDMPARSLVQTHENPSSGSSSSIASSSRPHSMQRVPVMKDSAAHFPPSVSPGLNYRPQNSSVNIADAPFAPVPDDPAPCSRPPVAMGSAARFPQSSSPERDLRHQSVAGIICGAPLSPVLDVPSSRSRTPVTVGRFPHSGGPLSGWAALTAEAPPASLPMECSLSSCSWPSDLELPLYSIPIEPSFGRKRSNSKFEPHADLPPISEARRKSEVSEIVSEYVLEDIPPPVMGGDGHRSTGAIYEPPVPSFHVEYMPPVGERKLRKKKEKKARKEAKIQAKKEGNKLQKKRPHEKTHKYVRYSRRFLLRRKFLNFLLGRQLGDAVADGLKAITSLPVGTDSLDLAVVAVPGGLTSPLHKGAVFPLAILVGRHDLESDERNGQMHFGNSRSCVALTAPDFPDGKEHHGKTRRSRHLSMGDLSEAVRHTVDVERRKRVKV